ncbi:hypothetical protein BVD23_23305 [Salmonella enterica]|nr:hypothetical protein [Salmonella enterica]EBI7620561.1 hypothetical protein [Salmonella enterica]EBI8102139.1 hypothetical protein [Salmonella enterica]EBK3007538.1 hypothetical protein [Salmonella enterica]EBK9154095.1 hypothetical protein [Salmonella enterica]
MQIGSSLAAFKLFGPSLGLTPTGPPLAAFKPVPDRFVTPVTYFSKLLGIHSFAALIHFE